MNTFMIVAVVVVVFVVIGTFANPVAPVAADDQVGADSHDLDTAEHLLEIIEKKIAKLYKKCLKHGGCQPSYGYSSYGHSADYGYGSSYGHHSGYGNYGSGYGGYGSGSPVYY
ncbi:hypothetical protein GHT06_021793 [Daphnia sinensis]|uniref:Uncharacterized protein n=1 Tax=Daphnia sinensis TaxID=1820382 RepID=A0AAD5PQD8_9CRUS|nr:hypothetical protein GHT06_021793 [Daphnia sinensis]